MENTPTTGAEQAPEPDFLALALKVGLTGDCADFVGEHRSLTWSELVEAWGWDSKFAAHARRRAEELGYVEPIKPTPLPQATPCSIPRRIVKPPPNWKLPPTDEGDSDENP